MKCATQMCEETTQTELYTEEELPILFQRLGFAMTRDRLPSWSPPRGKFLNLLFNEVEDEPITVC